MGDPNPERSRQGDNAALRSSEAVAIAGGALRALGECWAGSKPGILAAGQAISTAYRYLQQIEITGDTKVVKPAQDQTRGTWTDRSSNNQVDDQRSASNKVVSDTRIPAKVLAKDKTASWANGLPTSNKQNNERLSMAIVTDIKVSPRAIASAQGGNTDGFIEGSSTSNNGGQTLRVADYSVNPVATASVQKGNTADVVRDSSTSNNGGQTLRVADYSVNPVAKASVQRGNTADVVRDSSISNNGGQTLTVADYSVNPVATASVQKGNTADVVRDSSTSNNGGQMLRVADYSVNPVATASVQKGNTADVVRDSSISNNGGQTLTVADYSVNPVATASVQRGNTADVVRDSSISNNGGQTLTVADYSVNPVATASVQKGNTADVVRDSSTSNNGGQTLRVADYSVNPVATASVQKGNTADVVRDSSTSNNGGQMLRVADYSVNPVATASVQKGNTADVVRDSSTSNNQNGDQPATTVIVADNTTISNRTTDNCSTSQTVNTDSGNATKVAAVTDSSNNSQSTSTPQATDKSNIPGQTGQTIMAQNVIGIRNQADVATVTERSMNGATGINSADLAQAGGKPVEVKQSLDRDIDRRFTELTARTGQSDNRPSDIAIGHNKAIDSLVQNDAAASANTQTDRSSVLPIPGVLRDGSLTGVMSRDSNSAGTVQGMTTGQLSGLYANDKGLTGQGALAVRESNAVGYAVDLKNAGMISLAPGAMIIRDGQAMGTLPRSQEIGKGIGFPGIGPGLVGALGLPPVDGVRSAGQGMPGFAGIGQGLVGALGLPPPVESVRGAEQGMMSSADIRQGLAGALQPADSVRGAVQSVPGSAGIALGMGQGITILQPGQGAIKGIDDTTQGGQLNLDGRINLAPTDAWTGKKGSTIVTEGISTTAIGRPLGLITTKGDKLGLDVMEETKLPQAQTPANQSPLGLGIIASTTTTTSTQTTGNKDPNTQNTTTTQTNTSGSITMKDEDWENSLPEIEIVDITEKDKIEAEPVKQAETLIRKEVVIDVDDEDDDQFVVNEGKRGGGAFTPQSRPFDNIRSLIEVIIADAAGKKLDDTKAAQLFEQTFGDNVRRKYIVKPGDTIEEIALRLLKDKSLIRLLLNVNNLNCKDSDKLDLYTSELKPGTELLLPSRSEILRYKIHEQKCNTLMVLADTLGKVSREEQSEYIDYTCRFGDTLKSIARRYQAIADEDRWQEIALLNGLSTECDQNGQPIAVLKRGQRINLPRPLPAVNELEEYDEEDSISVVHDGQTLVPAANKVVPFIGKLKSATAPLAIDAIMPLIRVITQNDLGDDNTQAVKMRLEIQLDSHWLPVVEYDICTPESGLTSGLKIYDLYGVRQIIPLALPTRAARELAENDIAVNGQHYCKLFLTAHQLAA